MSDGDVGVLVLEWLRDNKFYGALEKLKAEMEVKKWPQRKTDRKRLRSLTFVLREYVELKQRQINRQKRLHSKKDIVGSYLNNLVRKMHTIAEDYEDFRRDVLGEDDESIFDIPTNNSSSLVLNRPRSSSSPHRSRKNQTPQKRQRNSSRQNLALPKEIPVERIDEFHANLMKNAAKIAERITSTVQEQPQHKLVENPEIVNIDDLIDMIDPDFLNDAVGAVSQDGFSNSLDTEEERRKNTTTSSPSSKGGVFRHLFNKTKDTEEKKDEETEEKVDEEQERKRRKITTTTTTTTKSKDKTKKKKKEEQENLLKQMDINEFVAWAHKSKS